MKKFHGEKSESLTEVIEISSDEDEQKVPTADSWHVFIRTSCGKRFMLEAEPTDTIEVMKTKIQGREKISIEHQKLLFNKTTLEDKQTLLELKIESGSTIDLDDSIRISFIVTSTFKTIKLKVQRSDTVADVKAKIKAQEGISEDQHRYLIYLGKVLETQRTLESYRVSDGSILHLVLRVEEKPVKSINSCSVV